MRVTNNLGYILNCGGHCTLLPGLNPTVDEAAFRKAAKTIPIIAWHVETGQLVPQSGGEEPTKITETEAIAMVNATIHGEFLEEWQAREKRAKVLDAIRARLEQLKPPAPAKTDDDAPPAKPSRR